MRNTFSWKQLFIYLPVILLPHLKSGSATGNLTKIDDIPLQVSIQYEYVEDEETIRGYCSGIIVYQRWILTALGCVEREGLEMRSININYDFDGTSKAYAKHSVVTEIIKGRASNTGEIEKFGFALIRVRQNFRLKHFSLTMKGIRLKPYQPSPPYDTRSVNFITGGFSSSGSLYSKFEGRFYSKLVSLTGLQGCPNDTNDRPTGIEYVCISSGECFGDSGGPLLMQIKINHLPEEVKIHEAHGIIEFNDQSETCETSLTRVIPFTERALSWMADRIRGINE